MNKLIYYPSFESTNETWLKYALLYIDNLSSIVPPSGVGERSELYKKLFNETDLLNVYSPKHSEGFQSTDTTIEIVERIQKNPEVYAEVLKHVNAPRQWQQKPLQTYKLYLEKYSKNWEEFCLQNDFAHKADGGLLISEQLGSLYMSALAQIIADNVDRSTITDNSKIDELTIFLKQKSPKKFAKLQSNAQAIIELTIPKNIQNISFDDIIKLRNSQNFRKYQAAFADALEDFYKNIEDGQTYTDFIKRYDEKFSDFKESILSIAIGTGTIVLSTTLLLADPTFTTSALCLKALEAAGVSISGGYLLKNTWRQTAPKRDCRRFLTKLSHLH